MPFQGRFETKAKYSSVFVLLGLCVQNPSSTKDFYGTVWGFDDLAVSC